MGETRDLDVTSEVVPVPSKLMIFIIWLHIPLNDVDPGNYDMLFLMYTTLKDDQIICNENIGFLSLKFPFF